MLWRHESGAMAEVKLSRRRREQAKLVTVLILVAGVTAANYALPSGRLNYELFYQALYFLPLILSAFWFGLRGAILTSAGVSLLYFPLLLRERKQLTPSELEALLEIVGYCAVAAVLGMLRDRERAQQKRIRDSERLAAMGRALSSLAHDMKTPLVAIGGFARLILNKLADDDPDRQKLTIVVQETERLEHMVRDMLDFSGNIRLAVAAENICLIVKESLAVVGECAAGSRVRLENAMPESMPLLECDGMRIRQLLINLLTNAVDSSPEGAVVLVRGHCDQADLIVDVIDGGSGIPRDQRHQVFDPFFSTKARGTGLGLPIVKKIIDAHQGDLLIIDNPDRGMTFRVILPLRHRASAHPAKTVRSAN
jgi:signal transduction histidine kinase